MATGWIGAHPCAQSTAGGMNAECAILAGDSEQFHAGANTAYKLINLWSRRIAPFAQACCNDRTAGLCGRPAAGHVRLSRFIATKSFGIAPRDQSRQSPSVDRRPALAHVRYEPNQAGGSIRA